ncbi:MAG: hypothetical protein ACPGRX_06055, partial [Bdellovibrionales bacterium]
MVFWRKKKNAAQHEQEERDEKLLHRKDDPGIEPSTDYEAELDADTKHEMAENGREIIEDLSMTPTPDHTPADDADEDEDLKDHTEEGGWLSRLSSGLSKSTNKFTK